MITLIACMSENRVIGKNGGIPWSNKEDLKHFRNYTLNKTLLMGSKTFASLNFKPLKNRHNIVLTSTNNYDNYAGIEVIHDVTNLIKQYQNSEEELCVIGGGSIYQLMLPYASHIVLSKLHQEVDGDTYFPTFEENFKIEDIKHFEDFDVYYYRRG